MNRRYLATDKQSSYVKFLLRQCFAKGISTGLYLDERHLDRLTFDYASTAIGKMKDLLESFGKSEVAR